MKRLMEHYLNALHVYCRLVDMGVRQSAARRIAVLYEKTLAFRLLYR